MAVRAVLALALVLSACGRDPGPPTVRPLPAPDAVAPVRGGPRSPRIASYKIDARLDPARHQVIATQTLTWKNTGQSPVERLPFHLYLNAFKNEASLFMRSSRGQMRGAQASDTGWGWIELHSVKVKGAELVRTLVRPDPRDPDETVVELPLPQPVAAGETVEVSFAFTAQLPEVFARTGYKGEFHLVGQWFPKVGVRVGPPGEERWECEPFHLHNEFFADFGTYDVTLTVPSTYVVAATGVLAAASEAPGGTRTYTYRAEDVHDFVWMADPYMEVLSAKARVEGGPVEVRVLYRPEQEGFAQRHLDAAVGAIEKFSEWFVPYPWPILTVIDPPMDASMGAGGMEYPTLVTTGGDTVFAREGIRLPEYVTVHEVGHNWFQGILASNEPIEAWLDEGVNEWADGNVMAELYGARGSGVDWLGWQAEIAALRFALTTTPDELPSPIASAASAFVDYDAYGDTTYASTARAMLTLEQHVGSTRFRAAMKVYARKHAFGHPTGRDLFATLSEELGEDLSWFFQPVFQHVGGMELSVRSASCRLAHPPRGVFGAPSGEQPIRGVVEAPETGSYECDVVIQNPGTIHIPVDVELVFEDGSTHRVKWDARGAGHWKRFTLQRSSRLTEVRIDPDRKIWLDDRVLHAYRLDGDGDAALRAGAWFSSLAQTLMQVVGP